jgi:hypothetical protein
MKLHWRRSKPPKRTPLVELERLADEERIATRGWDRFDATLTCRKTSLKHPLAPRVGSFLFTPEYAGYKPFGRVTRIGEHPHAPDMAQIWVERPWLSELYQ